MDAVQSVVMAIVWAALVASVCVPLAFTPWLMRKTECFAVTVPPVAQDDPRIKALKRRYTRAVLLAGVVSCMIAIGVTCGIANDAAMVTVAITVIFLVPFAVSVVLMLTYRRRVQELKAQEGWAAQRQVRVAALAEEDLPRPLSLVWNLLYVPLILLTLAVGLTFYDQAPDWIPMHADFAGNVDRWEPKSIGTVVLFPVLFEAFMGVCMTISHLVILKAKRPTRPENPAASSLAYALFARAQSLVLLVGGIAIAAVMGGSFLLSAFGVIGLAQAGIAVLFGCAPLLVGMVAIAVRYGQNGAWAIAHLEEANELLFDDDEHWPLGTLYWNPDDASVFVAKRFGIGWTVNWARPAAWACVIGIVVVSVAFCAVMLAIA